MQRLPGMPRRPSLIGAFSVLYDSISVLRRDVRIVPGMLRHRGIFNKVQHMPQYLHGTFFVSADKIFYAAAPCVVGAYIHTPPEGYGGEALGSEKKQRLAQRALRPLFGGSGNAKPPAVIYRVVEVVHPARGRIFLNGAFYNPFFFFGGYFVVFVGNKKIIEVHHFIA